jgi:two-component system, sensor histidine kinase and response regulator
METHPILIADDDSGLIRLLRATLEPLGVMIRETYDATSALAMVQRAPPHLVILDISMPGGNGVSACEMLKTDKYMKDVPVIILSAKVDEATRTRCMDIGAHFIGKGPNALAEVKLLVTSLLGINHHSVIA